MKCIRVTVVGDGGPDKSSVGAYIRAALTLNNADVEFKDAAVEAMQGRGELRLPAERNIDAIFKDTKIKLVVESKSK